MQGFTLQNENHIVISVSKLVMLYSFITLSFNITPSTSKPESFHFLGLTCRLIQKHKSFLFNNVCPKALF